MADKTIYISEIIKNLKDKGYSNAAISGILGNIDVETGGTFYFQEKEDKLKFGDELGNGYGLFQFDFMKSHYNEWLNKNEKNDSIRSQVDFMDDVIQGKKFIDTKDGKIEMLKPSDRVKLQTILRESNNPEEIALEFGKIFETPQQGKEHYDKRIDSALSFSTTFDQELAPPTDSQEDEITNVLESLSPRRPGGRVSMYKGGDPDQPGANFNQLLELAIRLENARTFAGTKVADASTEMEQYPDTYLRPGETLEDWTGHYFRKPNAAGGRIYGKYAQQLASGGRVGLESGSEPYMPPLNKYALGLGFSEINDMENIEPGYLSENILKDIVESKGEGIEDLLFKIYKNDPDKLLNFYFGMGPKRAEMGIKKTFNEGGRIGLAEGDTPSQAWMRNYFYSSGLDDKGEISVFEFINGPLGWKAYMEHGPGAS